MIIYKDILTDDDMFTDSFKMKVTDDGIFYEVEGNHSYSEDITKMDEFERMLVGNSSVKEDNTEESIVSSCHVVESHDLEEQAYIDKDGYQKYLKNYTAKILKHLEEKRPDDAEQFKANVGKAMKRILSCFDDWRFFSGRTDSLDLDGMLAIMGYHSDQKTPYMLCFRDGLYKEEM